MEAHAWGSETGEDKDTMGEVEEKDWFQNKSYGTNYKKDTGNQKSVVWMVKLFHQLLLWNYWLQWN